VIASTGEAGLSSTSAGESVTFSAIRCSPRNPIGQEYARKDYITKPIDAAELIAKIRALD